MRDDSPELNQKDGSHIVIECSLCKAKGLHVLGTNASIQTRQCLNCGYVTAPKFLCEKDKITENPQWNLLTKEMQDWSQWSDGYLWIPTIMTLPFGMLYPFNEEDKMKWGFAELVEIPEEEREKYPREDGEGFYQQRFDTEGTKKYDSFIECLSYVNNKAKFLNINTAENVENYKNATKDNFDENNATNLEDKK